MNEEFNGKSHCFKNGKKCEKLFVQHQMQQSHRQEDSHDSHRVPCVHILIYACACLEKIKQSHIIDENTNIIDKMCL
jgi:hypothetical protein